MTTSAPSDVLKGKDPIDLYDAENEIRKRIHDGKVKFNGTPIRFITGQAVDHVAKPACIKAYLKKAIRERFDAMGEPTAGWHERDLEEFAQKVAKDCPRIFALATQHNAARLLIDLAYYKEATDMSLRFPDPLKDLPDAEFKNNGTLNAFMKDLPMVSPADFEVGKCDFVVDNYTSSLPFLFVEPMNNEPLEDYVDSVYDVTLHPDCVKGIDKRMSVKMKQYRSIEKAQEAFENEWCLFGFKSDGIPYLVFQYPAPE
jgi:hypothetical protein